VIQEELFPEVKSTNTKGTIDEQSIKAGPNTRLAAYWPSVIFQNEVNQIEEAYYSVHNYWGRQLLNLSSLNHSALAEVPHWRAKTGSANFIYQRDDRRLFAEWRDNANVGVAAGEI
jgi:hypothetical protein